MRLVLASVKEEEGLVQSFNVSAISKVVNLFEI